MTALRRYRFFPGFDDEYYGQNEVDHNYEVRKGYCNPSVNISEDKDGFTLELAAPGMDKQDFKINIEKHVLEISTKDKNEEEVKKGDEVKILRREFCYTCFKRTFQLPNSVATDKIEASYLNGILSVRIPKLEEAKEKPAKQIEIN